MGGGCYSYVRDCATKAGYVGESCEQVFTARHMSPDMNICGKVRECRDSDEHPTTYPIIIALDVTGSMGSIPHNLITGGFPAIMKKIMDEGIEHPQVCFIGIGDDYYDEAPIQAGQFEASDELLDHWLKSLWIEGGGGGNDGESYQFAWWFAAHHTSTDHYEKRHKKGVLITIGDEPTLKSITKNSAKKFYGDDIQPTQIAASDILALAQQSWDVYHINVMDYSGSRKSVEESWRAYLGDNYINTQSRDGKDIPAIIAGVVLKSFKGDDMPAKASEYSVEQNGSANSHLL